MTNIYIISIHQKKLFKLSINEYSMLLNIIRSAFSGNPFKN